MRPPRSNRGSLGVAQIGRRSSEADRIRHRRIALIRARHLALQARAEAEMRDEEDAIDLVQPTEAS